MVKFSSTIAAVAALYSSGVQSQFLEEWAYTHPIANKTEKIDEAPQNNFQDATSNLFLKEGRKHP
jgi:hypothetical protein